MGKVPVVKIPYALQDGTRLRGYTIERILGAGGFGITYRARDVSLETTVAVKEYFPVQLAYREGDQTVSSRSTGGTDDLYDWGMQKFRYEADSLAKLNHPNIVGVNHMFGANNTAYMVLDFIDGQSMKEWLLKLGRSPTQAELEGLLFPLLDALESIHHAGLLHRDIAPKNIMLNKSLNPILIDFGAVRLLVAQHSQTVANMLTPGYAPCEQYSNRGQGPWTDIYALAATFYEAISGFIPPDAPERLIDDRYKAAETVARTPCHSEFLRLIDWGLKPHPKDRPQTIKEWRQSFEVARRQYSTVSIKKSSKRGEWLGSWFGSR